MMTYAQNLRELVASARAAAVETNLPNVRDRYLQSAAVWSKLAEQAERLEELSSLPLNPGW
jgi:hypothetical protein